MRDKLVLIHRYVGLVMAGFLVIAGLTGAILVWQHELEDWLNPHLMKVEPPSATAQPLSPLELRDQIVQTYPHLSVNSMRLHRHSPDEAASFFVRAKPGAEDTEPAFNQIFVNPYTGAVLGTRTWGDITEGTVNLMPFLYRLHYSLALGTIGTYTFGIIALVWTLDCFIGAYLTLPRRAHNGRDTRASWRKRWWPAWTVRWRGGSYKLNYDLHSAGGLWPWALLFVLAWSSVAFNLHDEVYRPVTSGLFDMQDNPNKALPALKAPAVEPPLGWSEGLAISRQHMADLAREKGFTVIRDDRFSYNSRKGVFRLVAITDRDISERYGQTSVYVDATTGKLLSSYILTGEAAGDTITQWLYTLHTAQIWGLPFRLVMTAMGLAVTMLSITGLVIWWRKREARLKRAARRRQSKVSTRTNNMNTNDVPMPPRG